MNCCLMRIIALIILGFSFTDDLYALDKKTASKIDSLLYESYNLYFLGDYERSIDICQSLLNEYAQNEKDVYKANILHLLSKNYSKRGTDQDLISAVDVAKQSLNLHSLSLEKKVECQNDLIFYYSQQGYSTEASRLFSSSILDAKQLYVNRRSIADFSKKNYDRFSNIGDYEIANLYADVFFDVVNKDIDSLEVDCIDLLNDMASHYHSNKRYSDELKCLKQMEPIVKTIYSEQSGEYVDCLFHIALTCNLIRDLNQYEEWRNKLREVLVSIGLYESVEIKETPLYSNLATMSSQKGDYVEAIKQELIAANVYAAHHDSLLYAKSLNTVSQYFFKDSDIDNALAVVKMSISIFEMYDDVSVDYAMALNNMSVYLYSQKKSSESLMLAKKAMDIYERLQMKNPQLKEKELYMLISKNISLLSGAESAFNTIHKQNERNDFDLNVEDTHTVLDRAIGYYKESILAFNAKDVGGLRTAYNKSLSIITPLCVREEMAKSDGHKENVDELWLKVKSVYEKSFTFAYVYNQDEELLKDAYHAMKVYKSFEERHRLDSLSFENSIKQLSKDDIIIDFFSVDSKNYGRAYAALLLKAEWAAPKCIKLYTDADINKLYYLGGRDFFSMIKTEEGCNTVLNDTKTSLLLWQKIIPFLEKNGYVYICPDGFVNRLMIENSIYIDNGTISDQKISQVYRIKRLNSK